MREREPHNAAARAVDERQVEVPRELPRGINALSHDVVLMSQRGRLLEAVVEAVAELGYSATTVQEITRRARVSRTTFYEQFANKEECFFVAYEAGTRAHLEHMRQAIRRTDGWLTQLSEGVCAYVELLAAQPAYARTFLLEVHKAGERALDRQRANHGLYADLLREWHGGRPPGAGDQLSDEFFIGAVGAINEVIVERLHEAGAVGLSELSPTITRMLLALFGINRAELA
jgi:AcrR family transcriptional regulator